MVFLDWPMPPPRRDPTPEVVQRMSKRLLEGITAMTLSIGNKVAKVNEDGSLVQNEGARTFEVVGLATGLGVRKEDGTVEWNVGQVAILKTLD